MVFWLFMLAMDLLIPLAMIVIGRRFARKPPEKINEAFGYRTIRSMRSAESWDFAHRHFGRLWFLVGLVLLPLSAIPLLFVLQGDASTVGTVGGRLPVRSHARPRFFHRIRAEKEIRRLNYTRSEYYFLSTDF